MDEKRICGKCEYWMRQLPPIDDTGYCRINGIGHNKDYECDWND